MNIRYFEKNGKWWLDIRGPGVPDGRLRKSTGTSDRAEAERLAPSLVAAALSASFVPNGTTGQTVRLSAPSQAVAAGPTLKDAYDLAMKTRRQWLQSKDKETLAYTFKNLRIAPETPVVTLTRDFVRGKLAEWLKEPGKRKGTTLSPSAVNSRLSMLSVLLEACDLPPHNVKHLSVNGTKRTRRMADRELAAVQSWLCANAKRKGALTLCDLITVALETCAREGELLGLSHSDVRLEDAYVVFRDTKNGTTRSVTLPPASLRIFQARAELEGGPFADLEASQLKTLWSEAREALGLKDDVEFVFHALRHEGITRLIEAKVSPAIVQNLAGHSQIATTMGYTHVGLEAQREAQAAVIQRAQAQRAASQHPLQ